MKKIVDYSVLVGSGLYSVNGVIKGISALKGKKYGEFAMIALGIAISTYAFRYALLKSRGTDAPEVIVVEKEAPSKV